MRHLNDETIENYLRVKGYRIGKARKILIDLLQRELKHNNAEEIVRKLKKIKENVNVASVYNNLNFLVEKGLIKENRFNNSLFVHYELRTDEHAHLVCLDFENVKNVDILNLTKIKNEVAEKYGFEIFDISFNMYGRCASCHKFSNNLASAE
jgi:Fe2+ or Zn2+ uptake regulation protein